LLPRQFKKGFLKSEKITRILQLARGGSKSQNLYPRKNLTPTFPKEG